jgi:hypothetical protein
MSNMLSRRLMKRTFLQLLEVPVAMTTPLLPFHIAFPVHSIEAARAFYGDLLGASRAG